MYTAEGRCIRALDAERREQWPVDDSSRLAMFSIVIPAYNEAQRLPESLLRLREWLEKQPFPVEVIVVDDGSADATAAVVRAIAQDWGALSLHHIEHAGKGAAVRAGARMAQGGMVVFADADLSMPVAELGHLREIALETGGIAIASREAPGSRRYGEPWYRHLMGRVFNRVVQTLAVPGIQDTQCGFKCMSREIFLALTDQQTITGLGFDVELLVIARRHGYPIQEMPIPWHYGTQSHVRVGRDTVNMLRDVLTIRVNLRQGRYDKPVVCEHEATVSMMDERNLHAR